MPNVRRHGQAGWHGGTGFWPKADSAKRVHSTRRRANRMYVTTESAKRTSLLIWLGVAAPLLRHLFIYSLGIATPGYSVRRDFLSELSAFDAPYAVLMGLFGIGLVGSMMIAAAFGLYRAI